MFLALIQRISVVLSKGEVKDLCCARRERSEDLCAVCLSEQNRAKCFQLSVAWISLWEVSKIMGMWEHRMR